MCWYGNVPKLPPPHTHTHTEKKLVAYCSSVTYCTLRPAAPVQYTVKGPCEDETAVRPRAHTVPALKGVMAELTLTVTFLNSVYALSARAHTQTATMLVYAASSLYWIQA